MSTSLFVMGASPSVVRGVAPRPELISQER